MITKSLLPLPLEFTPELDFRVGSQATANPHGSDYTPSSSFFRFDLVCSCLEK